MLVGHQVSSSWSAFGEMKPFISDGITVVLNCETSIYLMAPDDGTYRFLPNYYNLKNTLGIIIEDHMLQFRT